MGVQLSQKSVVTRKEHQCWGCAATFPKGTKMDRIVHADNGLSTTYWCDVCQAYWEDHMNEGEGMGFGEIKANDPNEWNRIAEAQASGEEE